MENTIIIEAIYLLLIAIPSLIIFFRVSKIYGYSRYKGLKYFSMAFLFLAIGFTIRAIVMIARALQEGGDTGTITAFGPLVLAMEFFLVIPGFLLLYSQVWQRFEKKHFTSAYSIQYLMIYFIAAAIAIGDMLLSGFYLMYGSQIAVFALASIITFRKYIGNPNTHMQLYFISMLILLAVWIINLIAQYTIDTMPIIRLYTYLCTAVACAIILYITIRLTKVRK